MPATPEFSQLARHTIQQSRPEISSAVHQASKVGYSSTRQFCLNHSDVCNGLTDPPALKGLDGCCRWAEAFCPSESSFESPTERTVYLQMLADMYLQALSVQAQYLCNTAQWLWRREKLDVNSVPSWVEQPISEMLSLLASAGKMRSTILSRVRAAGSEEITGWQSNERHTKALFRCAKKLQTLVIGGLRFLVLNDVRAEATRRFEALYDSVREAIFAASGRLDHESMSERRKVETERCFAKLRKEAKRIIAYAEA